MPKTLVKLLLLCLVGYAMPAMAVINCGSRTIEEIWMEGPRDDNHIHANVMLLKLSGANCNGKPYVYIENTAAAFPALMSMALAAKTTQQPVSVYLNQNVTTSTATQISIIVLK